MNKESFVRALKFMNNEWIWVSFGSRLVWRWPFESWIKVPTSTMFVRCCSWSCTLVECMDVCMCRYRAILSGLWPSDLAADDLWSFLLRYLSHSCVNHIYAFNKLSRFTFGPCSPEYWHNINSFSCGPTGLLCMYLNEVTWFMSIWNGLELSLETAVKKSAHAGLGIISIRPLRHFNFNLRCSQAENQTGESRAKSHQRRPISFNWYLSSASLYRVNLLLRQPSHSAR